MDHTTGAETGSNRPPALRFCMTGDFPQKDGLMKKGVTPLNALSVPP
jgi:hypothetical protein